MDNEMKKVVENLVSSLSKAGVKVQSAAVLDLGDAPNVNEAFKNAMANAGFKYTGEKPAFENQTENKQNSEQEQDKKEACFCPNCFHFEAFEEMLSLLPGNKKFYYQEIDVEGEKFTVKICKSDERGVEFMIGKKPEEKLTPTGVDLSSLTSVELTNMLNRSVKEKHFNVAQQLLNEINKRNKQS